MLSIHASVRKTVTVRSFIQFGKQWEQRHDRLHGIWRIYHPLVTTSSKICNTAMAVELKHLALNHSNVTLGEARGRRSFASSFDRAALLDLGVG